MSTRVRVFSIGVCLCLQLSFLQALAQSDSIFCGTTLVSQQTQIGGDVITSFGTLKVLLIMIDFPDDTIDVNNPTWLRIKNPFTPPSKLIEDRIANLGFSKAGSVVVNGS